MQHLILKGNAQFRDEIWSGIFNLSDIPRIFKGRMYSASSNENAIGRGRIKRVEFNRKVLHHVVNKYVKFWDIRERSIDK